MIEPLRRILARVLERLSYQIATSTSFSKWSARLLSDGQSVVQGADVPLPGFYLIPSSTPGAFATGRNPVHSALAVTSGIVDILTVQAPSLVATINVLFAFIVGFSCGIEPHD